MNSDLNLQQFLIPNDQTFAENWWQLLLLIFLGLLARMVDRHILPKGETSPEASGFPSWMSENRTFIILLGLLLLTVLTGLLAGRPLGYLNIAAVLIGLWLPVALVVAFSRDRFAVRLIVVSAYLVLALHMLGWLERTVAFLENLRLPIGSVDLTAYGIITGIFVLIFLLLLAQWSSRLLDQRIQTLEGISSSMKVLVGKTVKVALITVAFLIAIESMGLDLTVLTVFGGAVGLGLGFGLQKVVSNFVSGFILLTDRSIKPGDVIEIDDTFGWINHLHARYASVITRDGTEHLIPNEDLITQKVINWSYTHNLVRIRAPIGVSYNSDISLARSLVMETALSVPRVLKEPGPQCHLTAFGESSVDLELRFWIEDPRNGVTNVKSEVLLKVWKCFRENDIEIPYPQRDLHIISPKDATLDDSIEEE